MAAVGQNLFNAPTAGLEPDQFLLRNGDGPGAGVLAQPKV
jgi:hypothetical protein